MQTNIKEILNILMRDTDYHVFKCVNTEGNMTRISITVPKKCIMYYKDRKYNVVRMDTTTKAAIKQFDQFTAYVYNDMGFGSKLCTIDLCVEDIESKLTVQKVKFLKNERYYLFIDLTPIMCITRFYDDKYAEEIEIYNSLKHLGTMRNNIANIIVDVDSLCLRDAESNLQMYTDVTFAVYKLRTTSIEHMTDVSYTIPYVLLTEDFNYNNATLERLYDKIYEEYLE